MPDDTATLHVFQDWKIDAQTVLDDCERFSAQFHAPYNRAECEKYFGLVLHPDEKRARYSLAVEAAHMLENAKPSRTFADLHGLDVSRYIALCVAAGRNACLALVKRRETDLSNAEKWNLPN